MRSDASDRRAAVRFDRRQAIARFGSFSIIAGLGLQAGCAGSGLGGAEARVALLIPQSGRLASIGRNMLWASRLAAPEGDPVLSIAGYDTAPSAAGAAAAARAAGVRLVLGPLLGDEIAEVTSAIGPDVPVITFSNDPALVGQGPFVFGITPEQSVAAILGYARQQGVRRVAVIAEQDKLGLAAAATARRFGGASGLEVLPPIFLSPTNRTREQLLSDLSAAGGGVLPDAVLLPSGGASLQATARLLGASGLQLLGTSQWSGIALEAMPSLHGAWFAAPDPAAFAEFAEVFEQRYGEPAGVLAGLAYDATAMARLLAQANGLDRTGLLRQSGFPGVLGDFRLQADGSVERDLAILAVDGAGARVIGRPAIS